MKDKVLIGITGGEFGARGFLDGYDLTTGRRAWRWYSVPGPGEFGNDTWAGDSWKLGGSPMWLTGSYDPALNLVYWTVGNPGPQIDRSVWAGDNLFSDSVVALDPDTGSPISGWMYLAYSENGQRYISVPTPYERGKQYISRAAGGGRGEGPGRRTVRRHRRGSRRSIPKQARRRGTSRSFRARPRTACWRPGAASSSRQPVRAT